MTKEAPHQIDPEAIFEHALLEENENASQEGGPQISDPGKLLERAANKDKGIASKNEAKAATKTDLGKVSVVDIFHDLLHKERADHILIMSKNMHDPENPPFCLTINRHMLEYRTKEGDEVKKMEYWFVRKNQGDSESHFDDLLKGVIEKINSGDAVLVKDELPR
ncbi:MAG: hypothetical protein ACI9BD_000298 [Candidatus Marinamargulisbacteria bacterium]|jgi:hypothetical protein